MSRVVALTVLRGNVFGLMAPIVTGYVVALTGGYDDAFAVAAALLVAGTVACLSLSRKPIRESNIRVMPLEGVIRHAELSFGSLVGPGS